MATPRPRFRLVCSVLAIAAAFAVVPAISVSAAPGSSIAEARRELEQLNDRVDQVVEDYDEARLALARAQRAAAASAAKVARAQAQLTALQRGLGSLAAAAYRYGGTDDFVNLVTTSSPQNFLDRATSLDRIAKGRSDQIRNVKAAQRTLTSERAAASRVVAAAAAIEQRLAGARAEIEAATARQQVLLGRLESAAARRARLEREARARRAQADRASRATTRVASYNGPASGRAAIAVREAYRQLGKPYRWGASGPNSFDCSGLMMWVWGKAGVSLPHSSRAQYGYGRHVSKSELRPGDLVFYGHPIHHVGIYVGNGQYIAAPQTGDVVSFRSVNRGGWAGATRL